jgi:broad specificity phosphatase PhoE
MDKIISFIRHGESEGNSEGTIQGWLDSPLTELGQRQALLLGQRLAAEGEIVRVFASPLARASETAEIVASALGLDVAYDNRLREYGYGALEGRNREEAGRLYPEIGRAWATNTCWLCTEGEEGTSVFQSRVQGAVAEILADWPGHGGVAVVAHGGSLDMALRYLLSVECQAFRCFTFSNASLTQVRWTTSDDGVRLARLLALDDTRHLREV